MVTARPTSANGTGAAVGAGVVGWVARELCIVVALSLGLALLMGSIMIGFGRHAPIVGIWGVAIVSVMALRLHRVVLPDSRRRRSVLKAAMRTNDAETELARRSLVGQAGGTAAQSAMWIESLPPTLERRFRRVYRHTDRITYAVVAARHYDTGVRPVLADLADDRLRRHHGIDMADEPARARAVLGEDLWHAISAPRTAPPTTADLDRWLTALERLDPGRLP